MEGLPRKVPLVWCCGFLPPAPGGFQLIFVLASAEAPCTVLTDGATKVKYSSSHPGFFCLRSRGGEGG